MNDRRCADVEARMIDAIDGRLAPADSVRFHAHIEGCAACRERVALWRQLVPQMREAEPPPPDAMAVRRMQIAIGQQLAAAESAPPQPRRRRRGWRWVAALGPLAAAAAVFLWLRPGATPPAVVVGYAALARVQGSVRVADLQATAAARVPVGAPIVLGADSAVALVLDGGATLAIDGPGRLVLEGSAREVTLRFAEGKLQAEVSHRHVDQTFAVVTRDLRVEVRGTRFSVDAAAAGSRVKVTEGQVAVRFADGHTTMVAAGGDVSTFADAPPSAPPAPPAGERTPAPATTTALRCAEVVRSCQSMARAVRTSMRGGGSDRALRQLAEARRELRAVGSRCEASTGACEDELGYLNAEVLNQTERLDDATAAYRALDRPGAPPAMRQNALYAVAQIERRQGRPTAAIADFERALAAAPRGALHEDALVGAMESAQAAGDQTRARALAARYLREFPRGLTATRARRLAGDGTP